MRTAAIGLLRSTVLAALAVHVRAKSRATRPLGGRSFLASPEMLRAVSPVVFRPEPPDLFRVFMDQELTQRCGDRHKGVESKDEVTLSFLRTFTDSPEPGRLTEALNFYYALLSADKTDQVSGIERPPLFGYLAHGFI